MSRGEAITYHLRMGGTFLGAIVSGILNEHMVGYGSPFIWTGLLTVIFSLCLFPRRKLLGQMLKVP